MRVFCIECGHETTLTPAQYCCDQCGGAWEATPREDFDPGLIDRNDPTLWRYRYLYGAGFTEPRVQLGAGWTPLLPLTLSGHDVLAKVEYFAPTASFKDRGTALMINYLVKHGVTRIAEDSSGNAGASIAAYAAAAGIKAEIYVPAYASPAKQAQVAIYGAEVHPIEGPRIAAKEAAVASMQRGVTLATHAYHPAFLLGQMSVGWELWEQMGKAAPDWVIVPVGQGIHLLGIWLAFRRLHAAGLIERLPHLVAAQAERLAPVVCAFAAGLDHVPALDPPELPSLAEGLAINAPVRGSRLMAALRETEGLAVAVTEEQIRAAQAETARRGLFIEPTSATAAAAVEVVARQAAPGDSIVVALTGSGLKGSPQIQV